MSSLLPTLLLGLLGIGVLIAIGRSHQWYRYSPDTPFERENAPEHRSVMSRPSTWLLAFIGLVGLAVGGVWVLVTGSGGAGGLANPLLLGAGGALLVGYLLVGMYAAAKSRGHSPAMAVAETATTAGVLLLIAVSARLIV
jgi:hypothetical protein